MNMFGTFANASVKLRISHLSLEIGAEYDERVGMGKTEMDDLVSLIDEIVPFLATHNAEPEACDLLLEVDMVIRIIFVSIFSDLSFLKSSKMFLLKITKELFFISTLVPTTSLNLKTRIASESYDSISFSFIHLTC